jgi:patatin-like phospholipase/acyl hydrolase
MIVDGGGSGSMSQLRIINEFMERLASDLNHGDDEICPAGYFDLIGGVGVGGFVALLLGRLGMTTNQAMKELSTIGNMVFTKGYEKDPPEMNTQRLREAVETMLQRHDHAKDIKLRNDSASCKA